MRPHRGTIILVLGILSLIVCAPLGIFAWVMGSADLKAMDAGTMDPEGRQLTTIGRILGIIGTILFVLALLGAVFFLVVGGVAAVTDMPAPMR